MLKLQVQTVHTVASHLWQKLSYTYRKSKGNRHCTFNNVKPGYNSYYVSMVENDPGRSHTFNGFRSLFAFHFKPVLFAVAGDLVMLCLHRVVPLFQTFSCLAHFLSVHLCTPHIFINTPVLVQWAQGLMGNTLDLSALHSQPATNKELFLFTDSLCCWENVTNF